MKCVAKIIPCALFLVAIFTIHITADQGSLRGHVGELSNDSSDERRQLEARYGVNVFTHMKRSADYDVRTADARKGDSRDSLRAAGGLNIPMPAAAIEDISEPTLVDEVIDDDDHGDAIDDNYETNETKYAASVETNDDIDSIIDDDMKSGDDYNDLDDEKSGDDYNDIEDEEDFDEDGDYDDDKSDLGRTFDAKEESYSAEIVVQKSQASSEAYADDNFDDQLGAAIDDDAKDDDEGADIDDDAKDDDDFN